MADDLQLFLPPDAPLADVRERFKDDKFATENGCTVVEAAKGHAVCQLDIDPNRHLNGLGGVMGGCIFTLADFALAVGCNVGEPPTVSVSNTIEFLSGAKGNQLIAECTCDKSGRHLGYYTVEVTDNTGRKVAKMTATCYR